MADYTLNLSPRLYEYFQRLSLREPEVLQKLREQTHKMSMAQMQISPEQGQFMGLLIELIGAKKTLEIGTFTGYSTLVVALALPEDGKIVACDINGEWTKIAKRFWDLAGVGHKIDLRLAPALETLQALLDEGGAGTFDFAFIDADKVNYPHYYELSLKLLRPGGLMAIDNVLWSGDVADPEVQDVNTVVLRALNEKVLQDMRVTMSMVPIGDGVTLVRKRAV
jgi:predicted O-methyltransferase YrrM